MIDRIGYPLTVINSEQTFSCESEPLKNVDNRTHCPLHQNSFAFFKIFVAKSVVESNGAKANMLILELLDGVQTVLYFIFFKIMNQVFDGDFKIFLLNLSMLIAY